MLAAKEGMPLLRARAQSIADGEGAEKHRPHRSGREAAKESDFKGVDRKRGDDDCEINRRDTDNGYTEEKEKQNIEDLASGVERRNKYALSVIKRIENRLGGVIVLPSNSSRSTNPNAAMPAAHSQHHRRQRWRISVSSQVESLIRDATSLDNLSQMFEGWAPWI
eukprot:jgi/Bigna1/127985/aug1.5_g2693